MNGLEYDEFLKSKSQISGNYGFNPIFMPDYLYDFQKALTEWAVKKGKAAIFADCGLGKTPMQLVWAQNILEKTNKPVLIITPLAVSPQTIREGEKFNIECSRSKDGNIKKTINITNYERLHYFNPDDFSGVVCDECFPPDTPIDVFSIDNSKATKYIKEIQRGDKIYNAKGIDNVQKTYKRRIDRAVQISYRGQRVTCSENHPFFTLHGWRSAQDLQPGDYLMATETAMRLVRENIQPEIYSIKNESVLRDILLSEMEDEYARTSGQSSYKGSTCADWEEKKCMVQERESDCHKGIRADKSIESDEQPGDPEESFIDVTGDKSQTFRAWGEWNRTDITRANNDGCIIRELDCGICYIIGETKTRFSNMLQSRLRESRLKNSDRVRRIKASFNERKRQEERQYAGFFRVESVEILEQGNPELEKYRDADGFIYFYDIKAEQHPSFSVNGALVHNSSILKNFSGIRRKQITDFLIKIKYRLLCTATASPNDYVELGTSSEALGELGNMDMLSMFFKTSDNAMQINQRYGDFWNRNKWRFKAHSENHFWQWVCSWARALRKPSDIGFQDRDFILPPLIIKDTICEHNKTLPGEIFVKIAVTLAEQREERKITIEQRCNAVLDKVGKHDVSLIWCQMNGEGNILEKLIPESAQISGADSDDKKEELFLAFQSGQLKRLITKPKIGSFGLNFQHCSHMTFFPSHSFEQYYQGIRRCWRFGQKKPVEVDIITTTGELSVMQNLEKKSKQADKMFTKLTKYINDEVYINRTKKKTKKMEIPKWV